MHGTAMSMDRCTPVLHDHHNYTITRNCTDMAVVVAIGGTNSIHCAQGRGMTARTPGIN